jgi:hypothetical protein
VKEALTPPEAQQQQTKQPQQEDGDGEEARQRREWLGLWHLLERGQQVLALVFHKRWQLLQRGDWTPNSPAARSFFVRGKNKRGPKGEGWPAFQKATQAQRVELVAGTTERWDITLLCLVLHHSAWPCVPPSQEKKAIDALRKARNTVAHTLPSQLPREEASNLLQRVMTSLVALGEDQAELDRFLRHRRRGGINLQSAIRMMCVSSCVRCVRSCRA